MGRRREQLEKLLAKKDEQVQILESRIQAYTTRVSQLQTRLFSTLDALDQTKCLQEQELAQVERQNALLKAQLNRYLTVVKAAEVERDDMQDAVLKLIEKVEASSDYSKWPRSQIQLSSLSASFSHPLPKILHNSEDYLLSYAPSILASLRLQRDNECKAHARTRDLAEKRILALEIQLSRREIELERCTVGGHAHDVVAEGDKTPQQRISHPAVEVLDEQILGNEEIISILDSTVTRNKILEGEVKTLIRRLEEARASTSQTSSTSNSAARFQDPHPNHLSDQRSREPLHMDNNNDQGHDVEETRDPIFLDHPLIDHQLLRDLDCQIKELGRKVDTFAEERRNIQQTFPSTISSVQNSNLADHDQRIRELETECERLRRSEDDLRDELDAVRADAHARENDLLERIRELEDAQWDSRRDELRMANTQAPTQIEPEPPDLLDPFGTDDGEISMELATPLMPTSAIDASGVLVPSGSNFVNQVEPLPSQARSFPPPRPRHPDPTPLAGVIVESGGDLERDVHGHPYPYPETSYVAAADDHDNDEYYVDPPSVPLPPSPPDMQDHDHDHNYDHDQQEDGGGGGDDGTFHHDDDDEEEDDPGGDSPTLSQIELETSILEGEMSAMTRQLTPPEVFMFAAELHDVQIQLGEAQHAVHDGEAALESLEELVRDLHLP